MKHQNISVTGSLNLNGVGVATTANLNAYTASSNSKVDALIAQTGSYATTGSNTFTGAQVVQGTLTAQTLVVQTITSSIDFVTGSTRFGSLLTDTHLFTGSVAITGSLAVDDVNLGRGGGDIVNNTAVGFRAMLNNTTGNYNTAFGASASLNNATTNNNTAIGYRALVNSSGSFNTVVGSEAGQANTTGTSNTFIGKDAGYTNVTGTANTSIGLGSGYSTTVGNFNSFVGYYSGYSNSVGASNVFFGYSAGGNNTSGSDNVFLGSNTGAANTTGNYNSYLGSVAGFSNTTGAYNIFIGRSAGRFIANKSTGATILDNSIMIGFQASPLANNQTNQIVIGYDATGLGSNTTVLGNSSTTDTAIYGNLLLGGTTTGAGYKLDVTGTARVTGAATFSSNVGIASTPSAWAGGTENVLQVKSASIYEYGGYETALSVNAYYNAGWKYIGSNTASQLQLSAGALSFKSAITGTAGNAITWTTPLTITSAGNVGIGTSSPSYKLHLVGGSEVGSRFIVSGTYAPLQFSGDGGTTLGGINAYSNNVVLGRGTSTGVQSDFVIGSTGNIGIGTATTPELVNINSSASCFIEMNGGSSSQTGFILKRAGTAKYQWVLNNDDSLNAYNYMSGTNALRVTSAGNVVVAGSLSKGSGSFRIDHPLKPDTHQLVHSFIEGPQADLIYRGKLTLVNGKAQANIDEVSTMTEGTFEALCREVQCFTTNENGWDLVKGKVIGNIIYIESQNQNSTDEISWMVIGERKDKHMMDTEWTDEQGKVIVEPLKAK